MLQRLQSLPLSVMSILAISSCVATFVFLGLPPSDGRGWGFGASIALATMTLGPVVRELSRQHLLRNDPPSHPSR